LQYSKGEPGFEALERKIDKADAILIGARPRCWKRQLF
jgi:hypothetical protein